MQKELVNSSTKSHKFSVYVVLEFLLYAVSRQHYWGSSLNHQPGHDNMMYS